MKVFIVSTVLILGAFIFPGPVHAQMRHVGGKTPTEILPTFTSKLESRTTGPAQLGSGRLIS